MPNTRELRRRIRSVKNTAQITRAMQMVAATKMRRSQNQALAGRPYNLTLNEAINMLLPRLDQVTHPLLMANDSSNTAILLISTDKALCGALNTNLFRATMSFIKEIKKVQFYTLGKKGRQFVVRSGNDLVADFQNNDLVEFRTASQIAKLAVEAYLKGEIGQFLIIYPDFVSTLKQDPKVIKLLPVSIQDLVLEAGDLSNGKKVSQKSQDSAGLESEFLFEPNVEVLLEYVLNHFVQVKIYQAILETKASEHSSRMIAMKNATDNAKELVQDLTLAYNQTRQDAITKELLEITSALAALD